MLKRVLWVAVILTAIEFSFISEVQFAATEGGAPVVRCAMQGRITGTRWAPYTCARGNATWTPIPFNDGR